MHYLHKLQKAKKHNGGDEKNLVHMAEDQHHCLTVCNISSEGGRFAQELKTRHHEHAA